MFVDHPFLIINQLSEVQLSPLLSLLYLPLFHKLSIFFDTLQNEWKTITPFPSPLPSSAPSLKGIHIITIKTWKEKDQKMNEG